MRVCKDIPEHLKVRRAELGALDHHVRDGTPQTGQILTGRGMSCGTSPCAARPKSSCFQIGADGTVMEGWKLFAELLATVKYGVAAAAYPKVSEVREAVDEGHDRDVVAVVEDQLGHLPIDVVVSGLQGEGLH